MRWVLSPIIGNGTAPTADMTDATGPYRAKVSNYGVSHVSSIPGNEDGSPANLWALVLVDDTTGDWTGIDGDGDIVALPDLGRDEEVTADLIPIGKGTVDMPNLFAWVGLTMEENVEGFGQLLDETFTYDSMKLGG